MKADSQIHDDVVAELTSEPSVCAESLCVMVRFGVVTLAGRVNSYAEKCQVEHATFRVAGVQGLTTRIEVLLSASCHRYDSEIALAATDALARFVESPSDVVKVLVEGGVLTLFGRVNWECQRQAAQDAVKGLTGLRGVIDLIVVKPPVTSEEIKADVAATLRRHATSNASLAARGSKARSLS